MTTSDTCCSLNPYFKVHKGKLEEFKLLCERLAEATAKESGALYYGFSFDGDKAHCREGYADAAGVLAHPDNVGSLLQEALQIADLTSLEVHGPEHQLAQLRGPLAGLSPRFFTLECGFRR